MNENFLLSIKNLHSYSMKRKHMIIEFLIYLHINLSVYKVVSRDFRGTHTKNCVGPQAPSSQSERRFVSRTWFTPPFLQSPPWFTRPYFQSTKGPTQKNRPTILRLQNWFNHWYKKCIFSLYTQNLIFFNIKVRQFSFFI